MTVSAFTFIKNGEILGYPFIQSIESVLPIVDEFVINVGDSEDETLQLIKSIASPKIRIIESKWNQNMQDRGYVYGQQKMIAQFNCRGDWAFYVEGDEIYHENDLNQIKLAMNEYLDDSNIEALAVNFYHFYGNSNTYLDSPGWYRSEVRIIKTSCRSYAPDGLFWLILDNNKRGRYPRAKNIGIYFFHYGGVRSQDQMNLKSQQVQRYWGKSHKKIDYSQMDSKILKKYTGTHPKVVQDWLPKDLGVFKVDSSYKLTKKQKRHRIILIIENIFNIDLSNKHYKLVK